MKTTRNVSLFAALAAVAALSLGVIATSGDAQARASSSKDGGHVESSKDGGHLESSKDGGHVMSGKDGGH
jgi:hypothetical protein